MGHLLRLPGLLTLALFALLAAPAYAAVAEHDSPEQAALEQALFERINAVRADHDLPQLQHDPRLAQLAREHSRRMHQKDFFAHEDPDGRTVAERAAAAGIHYRRIGENIAQNEGVADPLAAAINGWLDSPGHRANILQPAYRHTGVGIWQGEHAYYFTQVFAALQPSEVANAPVTRP